MTKIHPVYSETITAILTAIFVQEEDAAIIQKIVLSNKKLGSKDRKFITENSYELIRYWRKWTHIFTTVSDKKQEDWEIKELVSFFLQQKYFPNETISQLEKETSDEVIVHESYPDWFYTTIADSAVDASYFKNSNLPAYLTIRINTTKTTLDHVQKILTKQEIAYFYNKDYPTALFLEKHVSLKDNALYVNGLIEIQDAGSQLIAPLVQATPEHSILDACAGAGGKTLHIADIMGNKGRIVATDIYVQKLEELQKRADRGGYKIIQLALTDEKFLKKHANRFDRILLDVPCSGTGTLKRNPVIKWKLKEEHLTQVIQKQTEILQNYSKLLAPNGRLVYATCSVLKQENQGIINDFLSKNKNFSLVSERSIPVSELTDGFYTACILKNNVL